MISFRIGWFGLLAVQGTLKSLLQHHSSKASRTVLDTIPALFLLKHIEPQNVGAIITHFIAVEYTPPKVKDDYMRAYDSDAVLICIGHGALVEK